MIDSPTFEDIYQAYIQSLPSHIPFCHLHGHSGYSTFDGFGTCKQRAKQAKRQGQTHLAITDHMSMAGNEEHSNECLKEGIIPIQGNEIYFMMQFQEGQDYVHLRRHMTILAKNMEGYKSLCRLQTQANLTQFYYKPIVDLPMLKRNKNGLIVLSGCVLGEIPQQIINGNMDEAKRVADLFQEMFGEDFYIELQPQNFDAQKIANEGLIKIADEREIKKVMTNDFHYTAEEDLDTYMLVRSMGKQEVDEVRLGEIREQYKELYISSGRRMCERWFYMMGTDGREYAEESQRIAEKCELVKVEFEEKVPDYVELDENGRLIPVQVILAKRTKAGLKKKGLWKEPYIQRAKNELEVILAKEGKADYYLMTADMVNFAKDNGVSVGPGRGSGAASLVAFAIGITDVDPVHFDLMFERFMTKERETIPDFDVDFGPSGYDKVGAYLEQKYRGRVAIIATVIRYKGANLINDLAKALNMTKDEVSTMKTEVEKLGYHKKEPELSKMLFVDKLKELEDKYGVCSHFVKIYNNPRAFGQHASGFAITPGPIEEIIPLFVRGSNGGKRISTSYEMAGLTRAKIVKIDALKLDTADTLFECCDALLIRDDTGEIRLKEEVSSIERPFYRAFTRFDIPTDDQEVFDNYCRLNVQGIFQYDTHGAKGILQDIQPRTIEELAIVTALDRPGALNLGQSKVFAKARKEGVDMKPFHAKYCLKTKGALVFQEDILNICRDAAGMTWGEASQVMKNLKGMPLNHPLVIKFYNGVKKQSGEKEAKRAVEFFRQATEYTFNKGHSVAYALLSYWTMWFKVKYPLVFFLASLRSYEHKDSRKSIEADAISNNIAVLLPHVNGRMTYHLCEADFLGGAKVLRAGYSILPGVGPTVAMTIDQERVENGPFKDEDEFLVRVNTRAGRKAVNKTVYTSLKNYGALEFNDEIYKKRCLEYDSRLLAGVHKKNGAYYHA